MDTPAAQPNTELALRRAIARAIETAQLDLDVRTVVVTIVAPEPPRPAPRRRFGREGW